MNISDAFKDFDILSEDVFDLNASDLEDALDLTSEEEVVDVFDPEEYEDDDDQAYDAEEQIDDIHADEHKSYIDKLILECDVCHSLMYKDKDDVAFNEELALYNVGEECPYCMSTDGFQLVGKVVPYSEEPEQEDEDIDVEDDAEDEQEEIEECANDIVIDPVDLSEAKSTPILMYKVLSEGKLVGTTFSRDKAMKFVRDLKESYPNKDVRLNRFIRECGDYAIKRAAEQEQLNEDDSDVKFETLEDAIQFLIDDEHEAIDGYEQVKQSLEMFDLPDDELEGWNKVIDFIIDEENKHIDMLENAADGNFDIDEVEDDSDDEEETESLDESVEEINIKTQDDTINIQSNDDGGMTVETTPNECEDCETTDKEMIVPMTDDEIEEIPEQEPEDEEDDEVVDEFDEDSFDEVAESYLKKTYSNVDSYITESVHNTDYKLIVEGKINFKSGKSKDTKFVLTFMEDKQGVSINAMNESLAKNYQNLQLKAVVKDNKFIVTDMK